MVDFRWPWGPNIQRRWKNQFLNGWRESPNHPGYPRGKWWKMMENDGKWWKMMENDGKSGPSCTEDQKFWKIWVNVPLPKHHLWRLHQAMQASPSRFSHPSRHPIWTVGKIEPIPQNLLPFGITCKCRIKTTNKHLWNYNLELPFIDDFPSCKPPLIRDFLLPRLITGKVFNVLSAAFWPFGAKK